MWFLEAYRQAGGFLYMSESWLHQFIQALSLSAFPLFASFKCVSYIRPEFFVLSINAIAPTRRHTNTLLKIHATPDDQAQSRFEAHAESGSTQHIVSSRRS